MKTIRVTNAMYDRIRYCYSKYRGHWVKKNLSITVMFLVPHYICISGKQETCDNRIALCYLSAEYEEKYEFVISVVAVFAKYN